MITAGVGAMLDHLTWCICENGDGILIPRPLYTGFEVDIPMRSRGRFIPVSFTNEEGSASFDKVFDAAANQTALEAAFNDSTEKGIRVRAVLITK